MAAEERWGGVDDVAARLGVANDSVYRWIGGQELPAHRVGRQFRFQLFEIDEWVRRDKALSAPCSLPRRAGQEKTHSSDQSCPFSEENR